MSKVDTTYKAQSMEDLAQGLESLAKNLKERANSAKTQKKAALLRAEAHGFIQAADVVRNTTIGS